MDMETKLRLCERDIIALVSRMDSMHDALLIQGEALVLLTKELKESRDDAVCQRIKENISLWLAADASRRAEGPELLKDGDVISPIKRHDGAATDFWCGSPLVEPERDDDGQDRFDGVPADTR